MSNQFLHKAIIAALQAGKAILEIYHSGDFDIEIKGDNSPLTKADTASHKVIMSHLETTEFLYSLKREETSHTRSAKLGNSFGL